MGDKMILNENEVKTCLEYGLRPLLNKYSITIKEMQLKIHDDIQLKAIVTYQDRILDISTSFTIDYKNQQLAFENIEGTIEYLFLQLNMISVLKQLIHDEHIRFKDNAFYYRCDLPIDELIVEDEHLYVTLT
ncbi:MAG: hypothetical protein ACLUVC_10570 [Longibaculum sp.]